MDNPQTIAALVIVGLTLAIFGFRILRRKSEQCGGGCDCTMKPKKSLQNRNKDK